MRQDNVISYADLEKAGWSQAMIEDYEGFKREIVPQTGDELDPNGIYVSNLNGFYFSRTPPEKLWFNPTPGELTGWIQLV